MYSGILQVAYLHGAHGHQHNTIQNMPMAWYNTLCDPGICRRNVTIGLARTLAQ